MAAPVFLSAQPQGAVFSQHLMLKGLEFKKREPASASLEKHMHTILGTNASVLVNWEKYSHKELWR